MNQKYFSYLELEAMSNKEDQIILKAIADKSFEKKKKLSMTKNF